MKMSNNKNTKNKKIAYPPIINYIIIAVVAIVNVLFFMALNDVNQFSNLSQTIFLIINIVILVLLIAMNLFVAYAVKIRKQNTLGAMAGVLLVALLAGGYLNYLTSAVTDNLGQIVVQGEQNETVEIAFVVYDKDGNFTIEELEDLDNKKVAVSSDETDEKSYLLPVAELQENNVDATLVGYESNMDQLNALFSGEVDAAALPSNYAEIYGDDGYFSSLLDNTQIVHSFNTVIQTQIQTSGEGLDVTTEPFTVLLFGVDEGRTDAIMVVSVNPISLQITITSVARDSYVPIACYAGNASDKINHARSRGLQCSIDTVEDLLDIEVDFYVETNFAGVVDIVDALGGIVVDNPYQFVGQESDNRGKYTIWVPAGDDVLLSGEQALAFARERHLYLSGDWQRQSNQQQVIEAMLHRVVNMSDVNQAVSVLNAAGDNVQTNMSVDQMIDFFNLVMAKMQRTSVKAESALNLVQTSVSGYNSGIWNESTETNLSIIRLYEGAIEDAHELIMSNLEFDRELDSEKSMKFSINWIYEPPIAVLDFYNEPQIASQAPPLLIDFYGKTLDEVIAYCAEEGIVLKVGKATVNNDYSEFYVPTLAENTVVYQSVVVGTVLSKIEEITIYINKHVEVTTSSSSSSSSSMSSSSSSSSMSSVTVESTSTSTVESTSTVVETTTSKVEETTTSTTTSTTQKIVTVAPTVPATQAPTNPPTQAPTQASAPSPSPEG